MNNIQLMINQESNNLKVQFINFMTFCQGFVSIKTWPKTIRKA